MRPIMTIITGCLLLSCAATADADSFAPVVTNAFTWEGLFAGGRLSALGGGDLADRSPAALLINPAPVAQGDGVAAGYDHAEYFTDVEFHTYGGSVEGKALRFNLVRQDLEIAPQVIRTAYNPEGEETVEFSNHMTVLGVSYDLGQGVIDHPDLNWSLGAAWRSYHSSFTDSSGTYSGNGDTMDLGMTLGWRSRYRGGWTRVTGAVSWQNAAGNKFTFSDRESYLPQPLRLGMTLETAFSRADGPGDLIKILLAYNHAVQLGDYYRDDSDHVGAELLLFEMLALRWGHSTRIDDGITSLGVGVVLGRNVLGRFAVEADWGQMRYDNDFIDGDKTILGVRARYAF